MNKKEKWESKYQKELDKLVSTLSELQEDSLGFNINAFCNKAMNKIDYLKDSTQRFYGGLK